MVGKYGENAIRRCVRARARRKDFLAIAGIIHLELKSSFPSPVPLSFAVASNQMDRGQTKNKAIKFILRAVGTIS